MKNEFAFRDQFTKEGLATAMANCNKAQKAVIRETDPVETIPAPKKRGPGRPKKNAA